MNKTLFHLVERNIKLMLVILKSSLIKKLQTQQMQKQFPPLLALFQNQGLAHLSYKIITFLDLQTIFSIIDFSQEQSHKSASNIQKLSQNSTNSQSSNFILKMLQSYYFLKQYLNKTDRSLHYSFYQEPEVIEQQITLTSSIVITQAVTNSYEKTLSSSYRQISSIFSTISIEGLLSLDEFEELKRIFVDPSLPLTSLRRENQGMFCNSTFQLYLVGLRFPHNARKNWQVNFFQDLQQRLKDEQTICFKNFFEIQKKKNKDPNKKLYQNLHLVRYMPHQININNFKSLLLENNTAHNLIVYIFTLTDLWIDAIIVYLESITDPYYKFMELITRYLIFRSLIIQLEESLGFLFSSYENLYRDSINDSIFSDSALKPKYCFWRPALSKWFTKMQNLHKQTTNVYLILLTQMREDKLKQTIESLQQKEKSWSLLKNNEICLMNSLEMNCMTSQMKNKLYQNYSGESMIQNFLYKDEITCESLVFQYIQYIIDLSVNEQTVHWCGHSQHKLGKAFHNFLTEFLPYNQEYYRNLQQNVLKVINEKQSREQLFYLFIQEDIEFLETKNVKAVILRQLIEQINQQQQSLMEQSKVEQSKGEKQIQLQKITIFIPPKIKLDFKQNDQRLKYFNQKARIFSSIQGEQKYFFQIPPLLSLQEILSKSIKTDDTSQNGNKEDESYEYISDEEQEESINVLQVKDYNEKQQFTGEDKQQTYQEIQEYLPYDNQLKVQQDTLGCLQVSQNSTAESSQLENQKTLNQNQNTSTHHFIFKTNSF